VCGETAGGIKNALCVLISDLFWHAYSAEPGSQRLAVTAKLRTWRLGEYCRQTRMGLGEKSLDNGRVDR